MSYPYAIAVQVVTPNGKTRRSAELELWVDQPEDNHTGRAAAMNFGLSYAQAELKRKPTESVVTSILEHGEAVDAA